MFHFQRTIYYDRELISYRTTGRHFQLVRQYTS